MTQIDALKILDASPDSVLLVSTEGTILWNNSRTEKMFGYDRDELLGQKVETLLPAELKSAHEIYRQRYNTSPAARPMGFGTKLIGIKKDGEKIRVDVSLSAVNENEDLKIICVIRDLSKYLKV